MGPEIENSKKLHTEDFARYLILAELFFLFSSTSASVIIESLLFILFIASPTLRKSFISDLNQPMVFMSLAIAAMVTIGLLYTTGTNDEIFSIWKSWRKILLIPITAALFQDNIWKERLAWVFILTASLFALASSISWVFDFSFHKFAIGITVHNHATQGMLFSVAAFAAAVIFSRKSITRKRQGVLISSSILLLLNVLFITPGRSGYLCLLVLTTFFVFHLFQGWQKYVFGFLIPAGLALALLLSPVANERIVKGIDEIDNYKQEKAITSMGVRMVLWENTLELIKERPLIGYGTGGFQEAYRKKIKGLTGWKRKVDHDPHNQFLRILAEHGILGLIIFSTFIGSFFLQKVAVPFRILGIGVLLAWSATSMFSAHFSTFVEGRFLFLWCGALLSSTEYYRLNDLFRHSRVVPAKAV